MSLSSEQMTARVAVASISTLLSILGSILIISFYIRYVELRTRSSRLLLLCSIANLGIGVAWILDFALSSCEFISFTFRLFFYVSGASYTAQLSANAVLLARFPKMPSRTKRIMEIFFHAFSWIFGILCAVLYLIYISHHPGYAGCETPKTSVFLVEGLLYFAFIPFLSLILLAGIFVVAGSRFESARAQRALEDSSGTAASMDISSSELEERFGLSTARSNEVMMNMIATSASAPSSPIRAQLADIRRASTVKVPPAAAASSRSSSFLSAFPFSPRGSSRSFGGGTAPGAVAVSAPAAAADAVSKNGEHQQSFSSPFATLDTAEDKEQQKMEEYRFRLFAFPIFLCFLFPFADTLQQVLHPTNTIFALQVLHDFFGPLFGFLNFILFSFQESVIAPASLDELLRRPSALAFFRRFLQRNMCTENLDFLEDIIALKEHISSGMSGVDAMWVKDMAKRLIGQYLSSGADSELNLPSDLRKNSIAALSAAVDTAALMAALEPARKDIMFLTESDSFDKFKSSSPEFLLMIITLKRSKRIHGRSLLREGIALLNGLCASKSNNSSSAASASRFRRTPKKGPVPPSNAQSDNSNNI